MLVSVGEGGNGGGSNGVVERLRGLEAVERVDAHGGEITVTTPDGPRAVGSVAVALAEDGVAVERLTLRTPTLDDVFLEVTGNRLDAPETREAG